MSSPIAHGAVVLLAWPALRDHAAKRAGWRRTAVVGALLAAAVAPDLDITFGLVTGSGAFAGHGGFAHSLVVGIGVAVVFALVCRALIGASVVRGFLIGLLLDWSHILIDMCTRGRGVKALWPFVDDRVGLPVWLFYGVRHSSPEAPWHVHLITLANDGAFLLLVWLVARVLLRRRIAVPAAS
jgi:membrane-bound metal-dependent hydrolase YbcI (DUF457 family)